MCALIVTACQPVSRHYRSKLRESGFTIVAQLETGQKVTDSEAYATEAKVAKIITTITCSEIRFVFLFFKKIHFLFMFKIEG